MPMSATMRMKEYLDYKGIRTASAEKACGLGNATLGTVFKNPDANIGSKVLEKFLNTYTDLSAEWLLRGSGNMLITDGLNQEQVFKTLNMPTNSDKIIEVWMKFMELNKGMQELYMQSK